jgi:hypothetical protein
VKRILIVVLIGVGLYVARPKQMADLAEEAHEAITDSVEDFSGQTALDLKDRAAEQLKKQSLKKALKEFEGLRGKKPAEIEELIEEGLLKQSEAVDEWGRSLKVELTAEGVVFRSAGEDGRFHTRDDWTLGES